MVNRTELPNHPSADPQLRYKTMQLVKDYTDAKVGTYPSGCEAALYDIVLFALSRTVQSKDETHYAKYEEPDDAELFRIVANSAAAHRARTTNDYSGVLEELRSAFKRRTIQAKREVTNEMVDRAMLAFWNPGYVGELRANAFYQEGCANMRRALEAALNG